MPGSSPRDALEAQLDRWRPVAACIAVEPFGISGLRGDDASISFLPFARTAKVRRLDGESSFGVEARLDLELLRERSAHRAHLMGYSYAVAEPDGREIYAFHWHPGGMSRVTVPHLHVSSRLPGIPLGPSGIVLSLSKVHVPTGVLSFAQIATFLLEELGVAPRCRDWRDILAKASEESYDPD